MDDLVTLSARARAWAAEDPDPVTRAEALRLADGATSNDAAILAALHEGFDGWLEFGTAGLRGTLGPGPGRMNRLLVRKATAGLASYVARMIPEARTRGVVIGHDARNGSEAFTDEATAVLVAAGFRVHRCPPLSPTPLVAFLTRHLDAAAGIVVTASHNPPAYNGYKVYWANGAQIIPPHDRGIAAAIRAQEPAIAEGGAVVWLDADVVHTAYLAAIAGQLAHLPKGSTPVRVAYTPLHGVGAHLCEAALTHDGAAVLTVPEQRAPDGAFPTVTFPNPEEIGAMDRVEALAGEHGLDVALANDPDADRLAVSVRRDDGRFRRLSGDELGALLGEALLAQRPATARPAYVAKTIVSSDLLARIAESHGATCQETLTGFKWLWNRALELDATHDFVFAYEEALGYAVGPAVRDKDGIGAALLVARLLSHGIPLWTRLEALWRRHGYVASRQKSLVDAAPGGIARHAARMAALRASPPLAIGGRAVARVRDWLPGTDCLTLTLDDGARVILRPSGTEPKLKAYLQTVLPYAGAQTVADADVALDALQTAVFTELLG